MLPGHRCQQGHPWIAVAGHVPVTDLKNSTICYAHHRQHASHFPPGEGRSYLGKVWAPATQPPTPAEAAPLGRSQKPARARSGPRRVARTHMVLFCVVKSLLRNLVGDGPAVGGGGRQRMSKGFSREALWRALLGRQRFCTRRLPQPRVWG